VSLYFLISTKILIFGYNQNIGPKNSKAYLFFNIKKTSMTETAIIAFLMIDFQAYMAVKANPVDALKYE